MSTRPSGSFARVGLGRAILAATLLFGLTHSAGLSASPNDCIEDAADGRKFCGARQPTPYTYGLCDEGSSSAAHWCLARGGQWHAGPMVCEGATPDTEDNLAQRALAYSNSWPPTGGSCSIVNDSGWDFVGFAPNCWNHPPLYSQGYLLITFRRFSLSCMNGPRTVEARKDAQLQQCPVGYESVSTPRGPACSRPIETCTGCAAVGNPITPASGIKILEERDYRHPAGLELVRHYHSFRFYEPFTTVNGAHSESRFGGISWRSNFDKRVIPISGSVHVTAALSFPNGEVQYFNTAGDEVLNYGRGTAKLVTVPGTGYYYRGPGTVEFFGTDGRLRSIASATGNMLTLTYSDGTSGPNGGFAVDAAGNPTATVLPANLLIRVSDSYGRVMGFGLNAGGHIITMSDPEGGRFLYAYTPDANLATVTYPDTRVRTYRYNEPGQTAVPLGHALTSIVDENGNVFAKYSYDAQGRAISSEHAGGVERYQFTYETNGTTTVVDPLGKMRSFSFQTADGVARFSGASQAGGAGFGAGVQNRTYDSKGNVSSQTDFNGSKICYAYDTARNLETVRVEGVPSATSCASVTGQGAGLPSGARKIVTEWHPRWRLPTRISEPGRRTTHAYNGEGGASCAPGSAVIADGGSGVPIAVLCARTLQATNDIASGAQGFSANLQGLPRVWNYSYDALGKMLTMDGPRTDLADTTSYEYHPDNDPVVANRGMLKRVTNPAGHITDITAYTAHGQPLSITDPNGLVTTLEYHPRQRLKSRIVGGETTEYEYYDAGQLKKVRLPDGSFLFYIYDNAHRLTEISDALGNRIVYMLDAMGNRRVEEAARSLSIRLPRRGHGNTTTESPHARDRRDESGHPI